MIVTIVWFRPLVYVFMFVWPNDKIGKIKASVALQSVHHNVEKVKMIEIRILSQILYIMYCIITRQALIKKNIYMNMDYLLME